MNWVKKNKNIIFIIVIILIILAINTFTVIRLVKYFSHDEKEINTTFGIPDEIVISENGCWKTIYPQEENFDRIISLNESGKKYIENFIELPPPYEEKINGIHLKYKFDKEYEFYLELNLEKKLIKTTGITFILTEQYTGYVCIDTADGVKTVGVLAVDNELVTLARETLSS